jgi:hypothetical protein
MDAATATAAAATTTTPCRRRSSDDVMDKHHMNNEAERLQTKCESSDGTDDDDDNGRLACGTAAANHDSSGGGGEGCPNRDTKAGVGGGTGPIDEDASPRGATINNGREEVNRLEFLGRGTAASPPGTCNGGTSTGSTSMNWAVREGVRRVRSDAVDRKMQWLTGVAAIGGFLFGYDTGVIRYVPCFRKERCMEDEGSPKSV